MADIKMRIRKLLAMAESTSEHEAKKALLLARQLMAEHKLSMRELEDVKKTEVEQVFTSHESSKEKNFWLVELARIIGERYCCQAIIGHRKGKKMYRLGFVGLKDDVDICQTVFDYAVGYAMGRVVDLERSLRKRGLDGVSARKMCNGFGEGVAAGIKEALNAQNNEHQEYALVLQIPQEVTDSLKGMKASTAQASSARTSYAKYSDGFDYGKKFCPNALNGASKSVAACA